MNKQKWKEAKEKQLGFDINNEDYEEILIEEIKYKEEITSEKKYENTNIKQTIVSGRKIEKVKKNENDIDEIESIKSQKEKSIYKKNDKIENKKIKNNNHL